ncbi:hypothetical protein BpHYR1_025361 [Brachionus plicatilis]|uniref:Uncharacterized protein n=1 Tax=Brachionus plicatilis TaxID=10195 RepID=A0A3M7RRX5_BRAPC|nr:hypothetical protein BpHYR1_025361 [Brachionus plicatilis]
MVLVPYGINPNFDIVPRVMVTSLRSYFEYPSPSFYLRFSISSVQINNNKNIIEYPTPLCKSTSISSVQINK